ncbi:Agamous-like MADS-box protein [Quillaja saponaria]|uniref:Agamous-like MADS-box protein n=1 Tax=Quillaja saponaria TaxID=32244 RepID=A0AAD7Q9P5_QUISA|nr:Agamous-like MADS-box protein [Quillaja saponaria]
MEFSSSNSSSNFQWRDQNQVGSKKRKRSKQHSEVKSQFLKLQKRKETLFKKSFELATLCDVAVCTVYIGPTGEVDVWPEDSEKAKAIMMNYKYFDAVKKGKKVKINFLDILETKKKKLFEQLQTLNERIKQLKGKAIIFACNDGKTNSLEGLQLSDTNFVSHVDNQSLPYFVSEKCCFNNVSNPVVSTATDTETIGLLGNHHDLNYAFGNSIMSSNHGSFSWQNDGYFGNVSFETKGIWQSDLLDEHHQQSLSLVPDISDLNNLVPGFSGNEAIPWWNWQNNGGFDTEDLFSGVGYNIGSNSGGIDIPCGIFQTNEEFDGTGTGNYSNYAETNDGPVTQTFPQQNDLLVSNWVQGQPLQSLPNLDIPQIDMSVTQTFPLLVSQWEQDLTSCLPSGSMELS